MLKTVTGHNKRINYSIEYIKTTFASIRIYKTTFSPHDNSCGRKLYHCEYSKVGVQRYSPYLTIPVKL